MKHPGIIAAQSAAVPPIVTRAYDGRSATGEVTVAGEQALLTWTFTPDAGESYAVFWSLDLGLVAGAGRGKVYQDGVEVDRFENPLETWRTYGGFFVHDSDGTPVEWSLAVVNAKGRNAYLVALKLEAGDEYAEHLTSQGSTGSYYDVVSLSFTPASSGSYLFLGFAIWGGAAPTNVGSLRLSDGAVDSDPISQPSAGFFELMPTVVPWIRTGLSGPQTFSMRWSALAGQGLISSRLLALRLDGFSHGYRGTLAADDLAVAATYAPSGLAVTRNVHAKDFLALAAWQSHAGGGADAFTRLIDDVGAVCESQDGARVAAHFSPRLVASSAGMHSWRIERKTGIHASTIESTSIIALLQLN